MGDRSPTNSIERGKRQRRRLQDSGVLLNGNPSSSNEKFHNTSDIGTSNTSSSQQQSNQGDDDPNSIGIPRFPIGILGGRGGGGGGTAASTAWMLSGPWLQLCSRLNLPIPILSMRGKGNDDTLQLSENWIQIYSSTFRYTINDIEIGKWDLRVPFVAGVLRKIRKLREKDLVAQLVDPTGSVECFFQEGALVKYGADIGVGTAVLAKGVAVWLSNTPGLCRNLCLHADAIQVVWPPDTPRPGEEELFRLQGLSKTTMPIDVTLDSLSSHQQNNTTTAISRVVEGDGGNEAAATEVPLEIIPQLEMGLQAKAKSKTSEEEEEEDLITAEAFKVEKIPSWNVLDPQSHIEQNTPSNINVHHHPSPAAALNLHIKNEEQNYKSGGYYPLSGTPPPFNCSVTTTTSSNPSPTMVVGLQKLNNLSQQPLSHHFKSSSAAQSSYCKGGNNSSTTRCDVEETTTLIQKEGGGTLLQNMSMVEKSQVSLHDEIKKTTTTNTEEAPPPTTKNNTGGSSNNNSVTSFDSHRSSVNSVQKKQQLGPTSITRGWGEALSEQNLFEAVLNDSDND